MAEENVKMLQWLNEKIRAHEEEVHYLEELLVTTSGPADQILTDLEVNRRRLEEYRLEYSRYLEVEMEKTKTV